MTFAECISVVTAAVILATADANARRSADYVAVPGGNLRSVLPADPAQPEVAVARFRLSRKPVTNAEFLAFVRKHADWQRGRAAGIFVDGNYLQHWHSALKLGLTVGPDQPVIQVSWFAALAYCEAQGSRLPTWHEWEFAAAADERVRDARGDPAWRQKLLGWYSRPSNAVLSSVGATPPNVYGVYDLHGLVWEWVEDFNALMVSADNREQGDPDLAKFCGAGALSVNDRENYAVLMRVAMLSSLQANYTTRNLGFRCAIDAPKVAR